MPSQEPSRVTTTTSTTLDRVASERAEVVRWWTRDGEGTWAGIKALTTELQAAAGAGEVKDLQDVCAQLAEKVIDARKHSRVPVLDVDRLWRSVLDALMIAATDCTEGDFGSTSKYLDVATTQNMAFNSRLSTYL